MSGHGRAPGALVALAIALGTSGCFTATGAALGTLCSRGDARCRSELMRAGVGTDLAIGRALADDLGGHAHAAGTTRDLGGQYECRDTRGWSAVSPSEADARALCGSERCVCTRIPRG